MMTSEQRRKRAKRLLIWYEVSSIGTVLLMAAALFLNLQVPKESNFNQALVFRNEILIPTQVMGSSKVFVQAIDIETGRVRQTEFTPPDLGWVADGVHLWSISRNEVVETDGTKTRIYRPNRGVSDSPFREFLYEGKPAVIDCTVTLEDVRTYRLLVWTGDDWEDLGRIATPGPNRAWTVPESGEEPTLLPRSSGSTTAWRSDLEQMSVIPCAGGYYLFHRDNRRGGNLSYRAGFDFVTTSNHDDEPVSALAPDNATAECSGWRKLTEFSRARPKFGVSDNRVVMTTFDTSLGPTPNLLSRQVLKDDADDRRLSFETVTQYGPEGATAALIRSAMDDCLYTITDRGVPFSSAQIGRFQHGRLETLPFGIECPLTPGVNQFKRFLAGAILVVITACIAFPILGTRLREQSGDTSVWRGHDCVRLSSLNRRYLARAIDTLLIGSPLLLPIVQTAMMMDGDWLVQFGTRAPTLSTEEWLLPVYSMQINLFASIALWILLVVTQGWYGITPGKWLCGIRLMTTRLRPCGLTRSLLRELLMVVDLAEPGMIGFLVSDNQQRVGDYYADTVVVDEKSLLSVSSAVLCEGLPTPHMDRP